MSTAMRFVVSATLSFAPEDMLYELLRVRPGSVSPLGLLFDTERRVELLVDSRLQQAERIAFHPCDNTQTVAMAAADFFDQFLPSVGRAPKWVEIHDEL